MASREIGESYVGSGVVEDVTRQFETGATRDVDTGKLDYEGFISPLVDRRYAEYMHTCRLRNVPAGKTIRASDNWQKGIPQEAYAKSLVRHVNEFRLLHDGFAAYDEKGNALNLEDVLCAIRFNVDGYLFEILKERYGRTTSGPMPSVQDGQSIKSEVKAMRDMPQTSAPGAQSNWHDRPGHHCSGCSGEDD